MKWPESSWSTWLVAAALAAPVLALLVLLFGAPRMGQIPAANDATEKRPPLVLAKTSDALLNEEAMFRDPTPLFLPTRWNATEDAMPASVRRDPVGAFQPYASKYVFKDSGLGLSFPEPIQTPGRGVDAFAVEKTTRPMLGFGERESEVPVLRARGAFVEILRAGDGRRLLAQDLPEARPPGDVGWQPLEFLVNVGVQGVVRPAVLIESSTVAEVDRYFENYLLKTLRVGERLRPGMYRICVGP